MSAAWRYPIAEFSFTRAGLKTHIDASTGGDDPSWGFEPGSLSIDKTGNGRDVLTFSLITPKKGMSATRLRKRDRVDFVIDIDEVTQYSFRGIVWTVKESHVFEKVGIRQTITCVDYGKLTERTLINEPVASALLEVQMAQAINNVAHFGITIHPDQGSPGTPLPDQLWEWFTIRQALEMLAKLSNWNITWDGSQVLMEQPGTVDAPFDIDDVEPNWKSVEISNSLDDYFNNIWFRYGPNGVQPVTEILLGTGATQYFGLGAPLVYTAETPVVPAGYVTVDRTANGGGITNENIDDDPFTPGPAQWHYDPTQNILVQDADEPVLLVGDTVTIVYNGRFPGAVYVADDPEVDEFGQFTALITDTTIMNAEEARNRAEALLQRLTGDDERVNVYTNRLGLSPFQTLDINIDDHVLDDEYMVLRVRIQHVEGSTVQGDGRLLHVFDVTAECVKGNQYRRNWEEFWYPNTDNAGTGGGIDAVPPTLTSGCSSSLQLLHADSFSVPDPRANWPDMTEGQAEDLSTSGGVLSYTGNGGVSEDDFFLGAELGVTFTEGCFSYTFQALDQVVVAGVAGLVAVRGPDVSSSGPGLQCIHSHNGTSRIHRLIIARENPGFGLTTLFESEDNFFSIAQMDAFRCEFKFSTTSDGYVRFYKNNVLVYEQNNLDWSGGSGFNTARITCDGILDDYILRVGETIVASASPSVSPSSSVSSSPSSSASPSSSQSPSPSPGNSPSVSPSSSASSSPSATASPSVSPSASQSPSSSASRSVSPSASLSPSASISPSAAAGFPSVLGVRGGFSNPASATHPITIPSTVQTGDLIVVGFTCNTNPTISISSGTGWTIEDQRAVGGSGARAAIIWKIADGSDTLTVGTSASVLSSHLSYRIATGTFDSGDPLSLTATVFTATTNVNPGSHTPPGGALNYLWLATYHGDVVTPSAPPSGYDSLRTAFASGGQVSVAFSELENNAASENPGAWTNSSDNVVAYVIAIHPV